MKTFLSIIDDVLAALLRALGMEPAPVAVEAQND